MYVHYNGVLRTRTKNAYVTTLHAINSGILKLSKLTPASTVYRGVSGGVLPPQFWEANEHGVMGGAPVGSSWWFQADVHRLAVVDPRPRVGQHASESDNVTVESTVSTAAAAHPTGVGGFVTRSPMFEEVVDIISQVDIVRCLVDAYDRGYPADHKALRRVFDEPVTLHAASRPFGTFDDAPVGAVFADMLRRGYSAAVVVARAKNTFDHAGDTGVWRAVDTLSTSDFRDVRDVSLFRSLEDGGASVAKFLQVARGSGERRMDAVNETASVLDAARVMVQYGVHRAWVISMGTAGGNAGGAPVGCVTATDVLKCIGSAHRRYDSAAAHPVPIVETPPA